MTINLFQTEEYKTLMRNHITQTIQYMFDKQQEFALACEIKHIEFNPELPLEIQNTFQDIVLFVLKNYSFETAALENDYFTFEAGFGAENFGSTVIIPILAIKQIMVSDNPIVLNLAHHSEKATMPLTDSTKNSMEALLKNPENQKLLKKKNNP